MRTVYADISSVNLAFWINRKLMNKGQIHVLSVRFFEARKK